MSQTTQSTVTSQVKKLTDTIELPYPQFDLVLEGTITYDPTQQALWIDTAEGPERLSMSLAGYGTIASPGNVFIKDWSEGQGVTDQLAERGLVEVVGQLAVGPFSSKAYEVRVLAAHTVVGA